MQNETLFKVKMTSDHIHSNLKCIAWGLSIKHLSYPSLTNNYYYIAALTIKRCQQYDSHIQYPSPFSAVVLDLYFSLTSGLMPMYLQMMANITSSAPPPILMSLMSLNARDTITSLV